MGFFDRFKEKPEDEPEENAKAGQTAWPLVVLEIAKIISGGDEAVLKEVAACTSDPAAYFAAHQEHYEERSVDNASDPELIQWLGLVDILEPHNHVCERDWKDEKEDFLYFLQHLDGMKRLNLDIQEDWLSEVNGIATWCAMIDKKWESKQCCVACIDIDSDSYVMFPCKLAELEQLKTLAAQLGKRIELAEKM